MGLTWSLTEMMSAGVTSEVVEEKRADGSMVTTRRKNPWVAGSVVISSALLLAILVDGGSGTLTRIFARSVEKLPKPSN